MKQSKSNLRPLYPFLHAEPSKAQRDEDAFMQEHGGRGARAIYLAVDAFSTFWRALQTAPIDWFLKVIKYESPMASKPPSTSNEEKQTRGSLPPRQRSTASTRCTHASLVADTKSQTRRRA